MEGVGKKGGTVTAGVAYWGGLKGEPKGYKVWGNGKGSVMQSLGRCREGFEGTVITVENGDTASLTVS